LTASQKVGKSLLCHSGDSEESDIIEIIRRSAHQNDTVWALYEFTKFELAVFINHRSVLSSDKKWGLYTT